MRAKPIAWKECVVPGTAALPVHARGHCAAHHDLAELPAGPARSVPIDDVEFDERRRGATHRVHAPARICCLCRSETCRRRTLLGGTVSVTTPVLRATP
jgi:hypothetical protein